MILSQMCGIFSKGKVRNNLLILTRKKNHAENNLSMCFFFFSFAFEERERQKKRDGGIVLSIFQCPWRMKGVFCVKASVCLETVSMETKYSYIFTKMQPFRVHVRDFMPNFRPPSLKMDYLGPYRYKLSVTMTTQESCLQGTQRCNPTHSACCCTRAKWWKHQGLIISFWIYNRQVINTFSHT